MRVQPIERITDNRNKHQDTQSKKHDTTDNTFKDALEIAIRKLSSKQGQ